MKHNVGRICGVRAAYVVAALASAAGVGASRSGAEEVARLPQRIREIRIGSVNSYLRDTRADIDATPSRTPIRLFIFGDSNGRYTPSGRWREFNPFGAASRRLSNDAVARHARVFLRGGTPTRVEISSFNNVLNRTTESSFTFWGTNSLCHAQLEVLLTSKYGLYSATREIYRGAGDELLWDRTDFKGKSKGLKAPILRALRSLAVPRRVSDLPFAVLLRTPRPDYKAQAASRKPSR